MRFREDQWLGNKWPSIDIWPVDYDCFLPILSYLAEKYDFAIPKIIDILDGYVADFKIQGAKATIHIDNWTFSVAFEDHGIRDRVLAELKALPEDFWTTSEK